MMVRGMRVHLARALLLLIAPEFAAAADDLPREVLLLARFKEKIRQNLEQIPNYTCLESVQRSERGRRAHAFKPIDTLLLEVTSADNQELLAWPGARRFEEADLSSFVSSGLIGDGLFSMHARSIFVDNSSVIRYHGNEEIAGRPVARYDFQKNQAWSGYQIRTSSGKAIVGTKGSFWFDPVALELVRIDVQADGIPLELGIEQALTRIDYARMRIGASDIVLPQSAEMLLIHLSGDTMRDVLEFSHCHEYRSESAIHFDMPATLPASSASQAREVDLPAGLTVSIILQTAIDSATAHVGDLLRGTVVRDAGQKGKPIIPKGATVTGRIRGLAPHALTIELAEVEWTGARAEFYGELVRVEAGRPFVAPQIPGRGVLYMQDERFHIPPGLRVTWRTLDPNQPPRSAR